MKKIDLHTHVTLFPDICARSLDGQRFLCAEEQIEIHDRLNVEMGVILPLTAYGGRER